jgi:hypothetical protein
MEHKKAIFLFLIALVLIFLYLNQPYVNLLSISIKKINKNLEYTKYSRECLALFKKIRHPKNGTIFRPPIEKIPHKLFYEFTQDGWMPLKRYWYINEVYADSASSSKIGTYHTVVTKSELDTWREKVKKAENLHYDNTELQRIMFKYSVELKKRKIAIIGTQLVWIEAISLEIGTGKITTFDYTRKKYEQSDLLEWIHVNDFLDDSIKTSQIEVFDNAVSFSSINYSGLGRYGDPLDPNGDFDAVRQIHCMLKPGGLFFLGLPSTEEEKGFIEFNAHRYYGFKRLELLFQGWDKLEQTSIQNGHIVYVLRKKNI